jgi:pilus assembly protein FimV
MARTKLVVALALAGVILSPIAGALGLGTIEVKSALNQPLDARIPLLPADEHELESLSVKLATAEAFQRAGIDRPFLLTRLKFDIVRGSDPYVHIFTDQPVKEPFLDFLVEADWARGRLVREFTLLLDPPVFGGAGLVAPRVVAAPAGSPAQTAQAATPSSTFAASTGAATPSAASRPAAANRYGPVSASDTLWKIAQNVRPDTSVSLNQTMVALLHANPDAFIDGDMNRLKRGSVLEIPDVAAIAAIGGAEADQVARSHLQRWRQSAATARQPAGRLQVVASEQVAPSGSAGEEEASAELTSVNELRRELTIFRENSLSLEAENEDLKAQVEGLKQELAQLERLINLGADRPEAAADSDPLSSGQEQPLAEEAGAALAEAEPAAEEPAAAEPEPAKQAAPASLPVAPPTDASGFFDDPRNLGMLGGVALALLGLVYLIVRRRRAANSELQEADAPAVMDLPAEEELELGANLEAEDEIELDTDEADALDVMDILSQDSDALSEAELYLGHGRYDQAREVLDKALQADPDDSALRLKLLEVMALMQEEDGFVDQARILRDQVDENDDSWRRALEMGRDFLPADPMFAADSGELAEVDVGELADIEFAFDADMAGEDSEEQPLAPVAAAVDAGAAEEDFSLDFDLPEADVALTVDEPADEAEFPVLGDRSFQAEQEQGLGLTDTAPLEEIPGVELSDLQFGELALDDADNVLEFTQAAAAGTDDDQLEELDEVGVKLNLARAYVDLGDTEGARSLLDEVLSEGSRHQREEAEDLLGQLA